MTKRCYITQIVTRFQKEEDGTVSTFHEPAILGFLQARDPKMGAYRMIGSHLNNKDGSPSTDWATSVVEAEDHSNLVDFKSFPIDDLRIDKASMDAMLPAGVQAFPNDLNSEIVAKLQTAQKQAIIVTTANVIKTG